MIGRLQCVVLDCPDASALARFYQALLGGAVNRADPRWAVDDDFSTLHTGSGLVLGFLSLFLMQSVVTRVFGRAASSPPNSVPRTSASSRSFGRSWPRSMSSRRNTRG